MGIGSIVSAVSGLAGLAGGLKGGKTESAPVSGYATYPQWLKDLYEKTFAPAALTEFKKEYEAIPMTRYQSVDPFFGSAQLNVLQQMSDAQGGMFGPYVDPNAPKDATGGATPAGQADGAAMADLEARMLAREYLGQAQNTKGYSWMSPSGYDDKGLAALGKFVKEAEKGGGNMWNMGAIDARAANPELATGFDNANQAMLAEIMKRKMMGA